MVAGSSSGYEALFGPLIEALDQARGGLGTAAAAEASVRRIAATVGRTAQRQGIADLARLAAAAEHAEPADLAGAAARLIDHLLALVTGAVRPAATVLVIDDDPAMQALLGRTLETEGHRVMRAGSAAEVLSVMRRVVVDLVLLDLGLPDVDGREILTALRNQAVTAALPVAVITASDEAWVRTECSALGATAFLLKPVEPGAVLALVDRLLGRSPPSPGSASPEGRAAGAEPPPGRTEPPGAEGPGRGAPAAGARLPGRPVQVLLAEPDPLTAKLIRQRLTREGLGVRHFASGTAALKAAPSLDPGLVVVDAMIPGVDGLELVTRLRALPAYRHVPIIVLSSIGSEREVVRAFEAGADECLRKPFSPAELMARIERLLERRADR